MTLNEQLAALGYATEPAQHAAKNIICGGQVAFTGSAWQVWEWLRETKQIDSGAGMATRSRTACATESRTDNTEP